MENVIHDEPSERETKLLGKHGFNVQMPDGTHGHYLATRVDHAFVVVHHHDGTVNSLSISRGADGGVVPHPIDLRKSCLSAQEMCDLQEYENNVPEDRWPPWVEYWQRLELCQGETEGDCNPGPADWDPCPLYRDICGTGIPYVSPVVCGISVFCDLGF